MSRTTKPLLTILDFTLLEFSVQRHELYRAGEALQASVRSTYRIGRIDESPERFGIFLTLEYFASKESENIPYDLTIGLSGDFASFARLDADAVPETMVVNALAMLYGVARGIVGQTTAKAAHGSFTLPAITFYDLVADSLQNDRPGVISDDEYNRRREAERLQPNEIGSSSSTTAEKSADE